MELLIYSEINAARLRYVAMLLLPPSISWKISDSRAELEQYQGPVIQYGLPAKIVPQSLHIPDSGFLARRDTEPVDPACAWDAGLPVLFPREGFDLKGDVLASIFFWLSRYEEYAGSAKRDQHGRFPGSEAHAFRYGYLDLPVVDAWRRRLLQLLFPGIRQVAQGELQVAWTFDIDQSAAFKGRSLLRQAGAWLRDLRQGHWQALRDRPAVMLGLRQDPYECFEALEALGQEAATPSRFFWHVGDVGPFDRVVSWKKPCLRLALHKISSALIGLHPSYQSADHPQRIAEEKKRLELISGKRVDQSRQHYLRLQFPATYRSLLRNGIQGDWSMGYPDRCGFRAGTGLPFPWFDLAEDRETDLWVHPFVAMDVTLRDYLGLDAAAARAELERLAALCRHWEIPLTLIWHNSSFYSGYGWAGWEDLPRMFSRSCRMQRGEPAN